MAKFNPEDEIEKCEFTFLPYVDVSGVVTEPSSARLQDYYRAERKMATTLQAGLEVSRNKRLGAVRKKHGLPDDVSVDDVLAAETAAERAVNGPAQDERDEPLIEAYEAGRVQVVADLCSGFPSVEQLESLRTQSERTYQAFIGYVVGTFSPKA